MYRLDNFQNFFVDVFRDVFDPPSRPGVIPTEEPHVSKIPFKRPNSRIELSSRPKTSRHERPSGAITGCILIGEFDVMLGSPAMHPNNKLYPQIHLVRPGETYSFTTADTELGSFSLTLLERNGEDLVWDYQTRGKYGDKKYLVFAKMTGQSLLDARYYEPSADQKYTSAESYTLIKREIDTPAPAGDLLDFSEGVKPIKTDFSPVEPTALHVYEVPGAPTKVGFSVGGLYHLTVDLDARPGLLTSNFQLEDLRHTAPPSSPATIVYLSTSFYLEETGWFISNLIDLKVGLVVLVVSTTQVNLPPKMVFIPTSDEGAREMIANNTTDGVFFINKYRQYAT